MRSSSRRPTDHGRLATFGLERSCRRPRTGRSAILTHCNTGPLACGQFGTALGVVQAAHHAGATGPRLGRRDAAVPPGRPADGLGAGAGRRPAHAAPRRRGRAPDGPRRGRRDPGRRGPGRRQRRHGEQDRHVPAGRPRGAPRHPVLRRARRRARSTSRRRTARRSRSRSAGRRGPASSAASGSRPPGTEVRNPAFDVTPAELITGIVTEEGVVRAPFEAGLRAAHDAAIARWAATPGPRPTRPRRADPATAPSAPAAAG